MAQAVGATVRAVKSSRGFVPRRVAITLVRTGVCKFRSLAQSTAFSVTSGYVAASIDLCCRSESKGTPE